MKSFCYPPPPPILGINQIARAGFIAVNTVFALCGKLVCTYWNSIYLKYFGKIVILYKHESENNKCI